jgi:predicted glycogen debranching enzyme
MRGNHLFLSTNGVGGMCRMNVQWGKINSRYDAMLAANLNPDFPDDRHIMFTRCRAWIVYQGYSQEICFDSLDQFRAEGNRGLWKYKIPTGQGERIDLLIEVKMLHGKNTVCLKFYRQPANSFKGKLYDNEPIELILRPDIEDRSFHENTKAYKGPESAWPASINIQQDAFVFVPAPNRKLTLHVSNGSFVWQPEWHYMIYHSAEKERGMDPDSDLFSPGYFSIFLKGNDTVCLTADINETPQYTICGSPEIPTEDSKDMAAIEESIKYSLNSFIVKRNHLKSVIAGYPWFLDWGRDALIFSRGLIQTGMIKDASEILKLFGGFEDGGTLPNMIHGNNTDNRNTSDAPLWFIVACADLTKKEKSLLFLSERCANRKIKDILLSIGHSYIEGTANHIRMDGTSGLIYNPACFTWMDTNYPACTPRRGYSIEIQSLWYAALIFLSTIDKGGRHDWETLAKTVAQSIIDLFPLKKGYLADYLHASENEPAYKGLQDDALRPNQLLAITLDAVSDKAISMAILNACQSLLVPGAIRSLADAQIDYPTEIIYNKTMIGNPHYPYRGHYAGDEDTSRKPAYHNGSAWTWLFPSYCEAYAKVYGENGIATARSLLLSSFELIKEGCVDHLPEILDGDYPHTHRGCDAQAWGLSEWLRVWNFLKRLSKPSETF